MYLRVVIGESLHHELHNLTPQSTALVTVTTGCTVVITTETNGHLTLLTHMFYGAATPRTCCKQFKNRCTLCQKNNHDDNDHELALFCHLSQCQSNFACLCTCIEQYLMTSTANTARPAVIIANTAITSRRSCWCQCMLFIGLSKYASPLVHAACSIRPAYKHALPSKQQPLRTKAQALRSLSQHVYTMRNNII